MTDAPASDPADKIDRLLDAIELVKDDRRDEAQPLLRELIREDSDFADAWLWMSVAVESIDQSIICLDNVLRINPDDINAATALHRLRKDEIMLERRRARLLGLRNWALVSLWVVIMGTLFAMVITFSIEMVAIQAAL